jgi:hypothetical protein
MTWAHDMNELLLVNQMEEDWQKPKQLLRQSLG